MTEIRIVDETPVDTGQLRNSWRSDIDENGFTITSGEDYGRYPEFGTPSTIVPKRAENLVFYSRKYGKTFKLRSVKGQKAQRFVLKALKSLFPASRIKER